MKITAILSAGIVGLAAAFPSHTKRSTTTCDHYGSINPSGYIIWNDVWNAGAASSGSQCVTYNSVSNGVVSWSVSWSWAGGSSSVKSYPNAQADLTIQPLSDFSSLPSTWSWSYAGDNLVADVAYDMFSGPSSDVGNKEFEVMVWLAAYGGAGPISYNYGSDGKPTPIATPTIAGISWSLYKGSNGAQTVYSYLPSGTKTYFSGDMMDFWNYLIDNEGFDSSQYLLVAEAGTEATTGSNAVFTVSRYSLTQG